MPAAHTWLWGAGHLGQVASHESRGRHLERVSFVIFADVYARVDRGYIDLDSQVRVYIIPSPPPHFFKNDIERF